VTVSRRNNTQKHEQASSGAELEIMMTALLGHAPFLAARMLVPSGVIAHDNDSQGQKDGRGIPGTVPPRAVLSTPATRNANIRIITLDMFFQVKLFLCLARPFVAFAVDSVCSVNISRAHVMRARLFLLAQQALN
jgi:hypothetical protein